MKRTLTAGFAALSLFGSVQAIEPGECVVPPDDNVAVVRPAELDIAFRNPGKGWLAYDWTPMTNPGNAKMSPLIGTVYTNYISWGDVEPYEGHYRWFLIDRLLQAYPDRQVNIGIMLMDPTSRPWCGATGFGQTPVWLSNELWASRQGRWTSKVEGFTVPWTPQCGGGNAYVFEPYYWSSRFLQAHQSFVRALAQRYYFNDVATAGYANAPDWSKRMPQIDMATYGAWGEWHSDISWPSVDVKRTTLRTMIQHYYQAFSEGAARSGKDAPALEQSIMGSTLGYGNDIYANNDPQQVRYSVETAPQTYGPKSAMVRKFLGADPSAYFQTDEQALVAANIGTSPFRLEWGSATGALTDFLGDNDMTVDEAIDYALSLKASEIGWYKNVEADGFPLSAIKQGSSESVEDYFQKRAGYRFYVSEFRYPRVVDRSGTLTIEQVWNQRATGKLYRKHYFGAYLQSGSTVHFLGTSDSMTAHTWTPGEKSGVPQFANFTIPATLPKGVYTLKFAVVDKTGEPAMNLAISGKDIADPNAYGRYTLGEIEVK